MAKELMEIGGFITEGAEIVNHDNTLSGNGTVESPLGVVPGYNETVLFTTGTPVTAFTASEPLSSFTHIIVEFRNNNYNQKCFGNLQGTHLSFGSVIFGQNAGDGNRLQIAGGDYTTTNYISWTSNGGNQIYFGNTTTACAGAGNKQMPILNVWGINRKQ